MEGWTAGGVGPARGLLQTDCPAPQLAGVSVGGWIAISVFAGILAGICATLLYQRCCAVSRAAKQTDLPTYAAPSQLPLRHPNNSLAAQPSRQWQPSTTPQLKGPRLVDPCFSPLVRSSAQLPAGSLTGLALAEVHEPPRDTYAPDANDQELELQMQPLGWHHQDTVHATVTVTAAEEPSQVTHPAMQAGQATAYPTVRPLTASTHASMPLHQQPDTVAAPARGTQPGIPAAAEAAAGGGGGGRRRWDEQPPLEVSHDHHVEGPPMASAPPLTPTRRPAGAVPAAAAGGSVAGGSPGAATEVAVEDEYEVDELDEDWKALLSGVDRRLAGRGLPMLDAKERAIAMRTLLSATHSRGADFAMRATVEEVIRFRAFQQQRQQQQQQHPQ